MVLNDITRDLKVKCVEEGRTRADLAEALETRPQYVSRVINSGGILKKSVISLLEELGYDVKIEYVKREE